MWSNIFTKYFKDIGTRVTKPVGQLWHATRRNDIITGACSVLPESSGSDTGDKREGTGMVSVSGAPAISRGEM